MTCDSSTSKASATVVRTAASISGEKVSTPRIVTDDCKVSIVTAEVVSIVAVVVTVVVLVASSEILSTVLVIMLILLVVDVSMVVLVVV